MSQGDIGLPADEAPGRNVTAGMPTPMDAAIPVEDPMDVEDANTTFIGQIG